MSRSKVSDKQRDEIVSLRQKRTKWTEIHKITGIDRRTAKNIYEKWERNSSVEELRKVRKEVAADEFRTHMKSIVQLAVSLASNLNVPRSIDDIKNSEEFFIWFWDQNILQRDSPSNFQSDVDSSAFGQNFNIRDLRIYLDEKKLLYKSLRAHTGKDVWNILDNDWKNATDKCAEKVLQLQAETGELVDNYFKDANEPGFLKKVKRATKNDDPAKDMTRAIANGIWRLIVQDNMKEEPLFETVPHSDILLEINLKFGDGTPKLLFSLNGPDRQHLAEKITIQCNSAITILRHKGEVMELYTEVGNIRRASDTIREMLNPLKLSPMILQTRCDLCPV